MDISYLIDLAVDPLGAIFRSGSVAIPGAHAAGCPGVVLSGRAGKRGGVIGDHREDGTYRTNGKDGAKQNTEKLKR